MSKRCALCQNKEANQTGSHIFTHGLIRSAINQVGITKRSNKEIIASISSYDLVDTFFGSNVLPETIEEVLNTDLTDEKIEVLQNKKDPFTRDYLFCSDCEKRFTIAENYFLEKVYRDLGTKSSNVKDKFDNLIIEFPHLNNELLRIFILIQLWRASVANYETFKLSTQLEDKLRKIIDKVLVLNDLEETIKNCDKYKNEINQFSLILTFLETDVTEDLTENMIFIDKSKLPYMMILNNLVIQFFEKEKHFKSPPNYFWGLTEVIERKLHFITKDDILKIGKIENSKRKTILNNIYRYLADKTYKRVFDFIKDAHKRIFGYFPPINEIRHICSEVFKDGQEVNSNHIIRTVSKKLYDKVKIKNNHN